MRVVQFIHCDVNHEVLFRQRHVLIHLKGDKKLCMKYTIVQHTSNVS